MPPILAALQQNGVLLWLFEYVCMATPDIYIFYANTVVFHTAAQYKYTTQKQCS